MTDQNIDDVLKWLFLAKVKCDFSKTYDFKPLWRSVDIAPAQRNAEFVAKAVGKPNVLMIAKCGEQICGAFTPVGFGAHRPDDDALLFRMHLWRGNVEQLDGSTDRADVARASDANRGKKAVQHASTGIYFGPSPYDWQVANLSNLAFASPAPGTHFAFAAGDKQPLFADANGTLSHLEFYQLNEVQGLPELWHEGLTFAPNEYKQKMAELDQVLKASKELKELDVDRINVLLLGPPGAGKTSLINTMASLDAGRIVEAGTAAQSAGTVTRELGAHEVGDYFTFWDTAGWEDAAYNNGLFKWLVDGRVAEGTKLLENVNPRTGAVSTKPLPVGDRIHVVVFVVPLRQALMTSNMKRMEQVIKHTRKSAGAKTNIRTVLLLSKTDVADPAVKADVRKTVSSKVIYSARETIVERTVVPSTSVFVLHNAIEHQLQAAVASLAVEALALIAYRGLDTLKEWLTIKKKKKAAAGAAPATN